MKTIFRFLLLIACVAQAQVVFAGTASKENQLINDGQWLITANGDLTAIILHDIFAPPIASRIYAYANVAAYEGIRRAHPELVSLVGQLKGLDSLPEPVAGMNYDFNIAGLRAFYATGKALVFSEADMEAAWEDVKDKLLSGGVTDIVLQNSIAYGNALSGAIIRWAKRDNYIKTRTFPRYRYKGTVTNWLPTPPDYAEGLEPYWNKIRPLVLDSASQFMPPRPIPYDSTSGSPFMLALKAVHGTTQLSGNEYETARYWDDNPFATQHQGHFSFAIKKVTPGGHWMGITAVALLTSKASLMESAEAFTLVSLAIFDGFISCWDEKYRSEYIRPVTAISRLLEENWKPYIQTPPFPEYTSGHSVISSASATVLTGLFGENYSFTDTVEVLNDLPKRTFSSFYEAAHQASISRFYGGIHYLPTLEVSEEQGKQLGNFLLKHLHTRVIPK